MRFSRSPFEIQIKNKEKDPFIQNTYFNDKYFDQGWKFEIVIGFIEWMGIDAKPALIVTFNDVSKLEKIRQLKMLHENKDRLLATVSHELRTPLNGIIGMLDIAEEKIEDKKLKKYLFIAKNSAKTLLLMINDILDSFQLQKGTLKLCFENIKLKDVIENVLSLMRVQIKKKGLIFNYSNSCSDEITVRADKNRLQQIILNLLSNAYKFTDTGSIDVHIYPAEKNEFETELSMGKGTSKIEESSSGDIKYLTPDEITIKIRDSGRGIKPEVVPELFKLFGKFEVSGNETGVGLGLAISQKLARQMNLRGIQVKSELGIGSEFWFNLSKSEDLSINDSIDIKDRNEVLEFPERKSKDITIVKPSVSEKNEQLECFKKILVVDDDQVNHMVIGKYLSNQSLLVIEKVFNGAEAVSCVIKRAKESKFFDLILMDCNMPVMDGFEATRKIKALVEKGDIPDVKIVAITANVSELNKAIGKDCGMDDFLPKPIQKYEFQDKVKNYLNLIRT